MAYQDLETITLQTSKGHKAMNHFSRWTSHEEGIWIYKSSSSPVAHDISLASQDILDVILLDLFSNSLNIGRSLQVELGFGHVC